MTSPDHRTPLGRAGPTAKGAEPRESDAVLVETLVVDVDDVEVWRYLGVRGEARRPEPTARRLNALRKIAVERVAPRGAYRIVSGVTAAGTGMPRLAERVAVAVCTIGRDLEAAVEEFTRAGDLRDALVLDAFGSAAAEGAADALDRCIREAVAPLGLSAGSRRSPGYGSWETERQSDLLALLPIDRLGISLTSGSMMIPRKSVSFAMALGSGPREPRKPPCEECGRADCAHRTDGAPEGGDER